MDKKTFKEIIDLHTAINKGVSANSKSGMRVVDGDIVMAGARFVPDNGMNRSHVVAKIESVAGSHVNANLDTDMIGKLKKVKKFNTVTINDSEVQFDHDLVVRNNSGVPNAFEMSDYSEIADSRVTTEFTTYADVITALLKTHGKFVSDDVTRTFMLGVYFEFDGSNYITATATDGRRLVTDKIKGWYTVQNEDESNVVPVQALSIASKLTDPNDKVTFTVYENGGFRVSFNRISLYFWKQTGMFPNYKRVIPKYEDYTSGLINRVSFLNALEKIKPLMGKDNRIVLNFTSNKLEVYTDKNHNDFERLDVRQNFDFSAFPKDENLVKQLMAFNIDFLIDTFKSVAAENIKFHYLGSQSATVFTTGKDIEFVIMPMQLPQELKW